MAPRVGIELGGGLLLRVCAGFAPIGVGVPLVCAEVSRKPGAVQAPRLEGQALSRDLPATLDPPDVDLNEGGEVAERAVPEENGLRLREGSPSDPAAAEPALAEPAQRVQRHHLDRLDPATEVSRPGLHVRDDETLKPEEPRGSIHRPLVRHV